MKSAITDALKHAMQLHQARRLAEAEAVYRQIVHDYPHHAFAVHLLGVVEMQSGRLNEAIGHLERAVMIGPAPFEYHLPLVEALMSAGQLDRAATWQRKAIELRPRWADGQNNLGVICDRLGRYEDAIAAYRAALAVNPNDPKVYRNLGDALRQSGNLEAAEQSYREAVRLNPSLGDAYNGIGLTLYLRNRFAEAIEQYKIAMRLNPADTNPCINLVLCYGRLGDHSHIEDVLRRTMAIAPGDAKTHSTLVMLMNYTRGHELPAVLIESLEFYRRHAATLMPVNPPAITSGVDRPLRIGYISPDFRHHPVAIFLEPLLRHHDRERFTIVCYSDVGSPDDFTAKFRSIADEWRDIHGRPDEQVAQQIRTDKIDILIDLAGHTSENRLLVLARKPAPIQATWLGYPNTTGIAAVDYRITDVWADPPEAEAFYTEKLVRLPAAFFVYQPPEIDVPVSPLPMLASGAVTFGSFNNITKITPAMGRVWSEILRKTPGSKLIIAGIPPDARERILSTIAGDDVTADRVEFPITIGFGEMLKLHHRVDVALDSFPYTGHTTTCNSLWMGVPVVSLAGPTAVSRSGVSIMANLGMLDEWVAANEADYVRTAVRWAGRSSELRELRGELRKKFVNSVLSDAARFARDFEAALIGMIQK